MATLKYQEVLVYLKEQIQRGKYSIGDYLPSENELCLQFSITRTTARKALDELLKEGFIEKIHGKGSRVAERRKSLGLLSVKGFSEAVGENVHTEFLQSPVKIEWSDEIQHPLNEDDKSAECIFFERLRFVGDSPVMIGKNWFPSTELPGFLDLEFVEGSFFKTSNQKLNIYSELYCNTNMFPIGNQVNL